MTLRAADVTYAYGATPVLEDCSLAARGGETLVVIGPSGVGKTTLLRLLALARDPLDGRIEVDGVDAWAATERRRLALRRRIGVVPQSPGLFDASVAANVGYGLRVRRSWRDRLRDAWASVAGRRESPDAVRDALETVGMSDALDRHAASLSGGEAKRVAFARALAYDPDALLLDEPTSDLDPRNTAAIERAVGAARDRGIAVVVATHDMQQAERVADRVAVLLGDGVTEVGPPEAVFESPDDDRTRRFVAGELVYEA